jgi:DNA-binding beta-propeller fold protein YncE
MMRALLPLLAIGCNPWPDLNETYINAMWNTSIVTLDDGVYVHLEESGQLIRVGTDDSWQVVDLDGARPVRMEADSFKDRLLVHVEWPVCEDQSKQIKLVEDCPDAALSWGTELAIVNNGKRSAVANVPGHLNAMTFTPDGDTAVAYLDDDQSIDNASGPLVDLSEILLVDLNNGDTSSISVGFMPRNVLFTRDGTRAVVMSRSTVVVVELEERAVSIEYPLTLDADIEIDPSAAVLSPDDRYVMIAIEGTQDLYKLDLEVVSIDMEGLEGIPSDMATDHTFAQTVVVYGDRAQVDLITEHDFIERVSLEIDDPATDIAMSEGQAVLFNTSHMDVRDIVRVDLETKEIVEYVAANPVDSLQLTPNSDYAVAILRPESDYGYGGSSLDQYQDNRWGLAVADLLGDNIISLVLESKPVGLEVIQKDDGAYALLLLDGVDSLIQVNLAEPGNYEAIELPSAPAGIDASPDGGFTIAHVSALGQVSFLDPASGDIRTTSGFATSGMLAETTLPRRDQE